MKYGNRSIWKKIGNSPLTLLVILIISVLLVRATFNIREKTLLGQEKLSRAEAELIKLEEKKKVLTDRVAYLSTEQGVEAELRTKYRAVKEGESVAVILDDKNQAAALVASSADTSDADLSWWGRFIRFVGF